MLNDYLKNPRDVRLELAGRAKAERLRQKGLDLPDSIITEEELGDALCQLS